MEVGEDGVVEVVDHLRVAPLVGQIADNRAPPVSGRSARDMAAGVAVGNSNGVSSSTRVSIIARMMLSSSTSYQSNGEAVPRE